MIQIDESDKSDMSSDAKALLCKIKKDVESVLSKADLIPFNKVLESIEYGIMELTIN